MRARARIHAMFPLDADTERELDVRLDAYRAQVAAATRREDAAFLLNEERPKHASRAIFCDGITHVAHLLTERANNGSEAAS